MPQRLCERAQVLLASAAGLSTYDIEEKYGLTRNKVRRWLDRYEADGLAGIETDRPRSGRPRTITSELETEVVHRTLHTKPDEATHWSTRLLVNAMGLSQVAVHRIWCAHGLKLHRMDYFKLSSDPHFVSKLRDVVGLYLDPPERAIVVSFDEKSQIQALDRMPLKKGPARTITAR